MDLNRNTPTNDWKKSVTMPGGSAPLSEPEPKALANFVLSQPPKLVLAYHATVGVVVPNDSDNSRTLAGIYMTRIQMSTTSARALPKGFFNCDSTDAFEDWLHDKYSIPTLLELWTKSGNEFSGHQDSMWAMINS